ncbi:MAG TPA: hypothetical protein VGR07_05175 [Thermoanaerobaculia bacterium]|jgi:hypothetical protein|nr:hypothetical protein [Thermoanaerobaculia bacterium]
MKTDEDEEESSPKVIRGVRIVPTAVRDIDFSEQANRPGPGEFPRKKVPLNPMPLPRGGPVPPDEVLNRDDEE